MRNLIDKLMLLGLCLLLIPMHKIQPLSIAALLTAVAVTSLNSYFQNRISVFLCAGYLLLCLWRGEFITLLPVIAYDLKGQEFRFLRFAWIFPILIYLNEMELFYLLVVTLFSLLAVFMRMRTTAFEDMKQQLHALQDTAKEKAMYLERKNQELMEKQDYEVRLATLGERNRIAREIHDNVGHLLTRSILQVKACQVMYGQNQEFVEAFDSVGNTLSEAMDSIRSSVHDLHEESIDLKLQIRSLIEEFNFCTVKLNYNAGELPKPLKYSFIAIVREALSNIAKHSNATWAVITVLEHPALYQLIVEDNGTLKAQADPNGIGLQSMKDRVASFGGVFRAERIKGFKLFISIPKER